MYRYAVPGSDGVCLFAIESLTRIRMPRAFQPCDRPEYPLGSGHSLSPILVVDAGHFQRLRRRCPCFYGKDLDSGEASL